MNSPGSQGFGPISGLLTSSFQGSAAGSEARYGQHAVAASTCVHGCVLLLGAVITPKQQLLDSTALAAAAGGTVGAANGVNGVDSVGGLNAAACPDASKLAAPGDFEVAGGEEEAVVGVVRDVVRWEGTAADGMQ